jgi:hypothetical protein
MDKIITVLKAAFVNLNQIQEVSIEYRQLIIGTIDTFINFKTWFLLLAKEARIP